MAKLISVIIPLLLLAGFILALLLGGISFQLQNNTPSKITDDSKIQNLTSDLASALSLSSSNANSANQAFSNSSISTSGVTPFISAVGGIWTVITKGPVLLYNIISLFVFETLFGNPAAFFISGIVATIFILIIISAVVYWVSRGEGGG